MSSQKMETSSKMEIDLQPEQSSPKTEAPPKMLIDIIEMDRIEAQIDPKLVIVNAAINKLLRTEILATEYRCLDTVAIISGKVVDTYMMICYKPNCVSNNENLIK